MKHSHLTRLLSNNFNGFWRNLVTVETVMQVSNTAAPSADVIILLWRFMLCGFVCVCIKLLSAGISFHNVIVIPSPLAVFTIDLPEAAAKYYFISLMTAAVRASAAMINQLISLFLTYVQSKFSIFSAFFTPFEQWTEYIWVLVKSKHLRTAFHALINIF